MKWAISQTSGYATAAIAQSEDIAEPLPAGAAIDSATITTSPGDFLDIRGCNPGFNTMDPGSCIKYFLINVNPGTNPGSWEQFDPGTLGLFTTSGNELYFKVELEGDGTTTSTVNNLTIEYGYSGDRYIYRAESVVDKQTRVLVQGSFRQGVAPSEGMIEPYDLTVMPPNRLAEIRGGAGDLWNGTRTVYTSNGAGSRVDYTSATAGGLNATQVSDVKALALGGIDHAAPVVVRGVVFPSWYYLLGNSSPTEKTKFDAFRSANHQRTTHWFIGSGDGMMHALDGEPETSSGLLNPDFGKELWAYVPYAYRSNIINNTDIDPSNDVQVDVPATLADCYDPRLTYEKFRSLLVFPLDGDLNEVVCLDVTDPVNPEVMWEFPASSASVPGFSSANYDNFRGVLAMGRILGDPTGDPKGRFVVFGISAVKFSGDVHPVTGVPGPGYTVRIFVLDAITGELIKDFPIYYPTTVTNYAPPGPSVADRDKDGYLDIIFYPDLYGDLQTVSLGSRIAGTFQIDEDDDPNLWTQETFYEDTDATFDDLAFGYARAAVGHATNGDMLAFYGTAGDGNNRFYGICVMGTCTEKDPVFIIGDNESYLQQERVIASPVMVNNNVFFFGTGNEYLDGGGSQDLRNR